MKGQTTRKDRRADRKPRSERERLDANHDSNTRGEHRYADAHQTVAEQQARRDRDNLKRVLSNQRPQSHRRQG
jgi:hypothetical protein